MCIRDRFRVAEETRVPALTLLDAMKGQTGLNLTASLAYYLNSIRSRATLLGINASTVYNTFKGKNLKSIVKSEVTAIGTQVIVGSLPGAIRSVANKADGVFFPTATAARNTATVNQINQGQIAGGGV